MVEYHVIFLQDGIGICDAEINWLPEVGDIVYLIKADANSAAYRVKQRCWHHKLGEKLGKPEVDIHVVPYSREKEEELRRTLELAMQYR